jgi:hypothetical protein
MSEELSTGWAHEDDMAFWREQVAEYVKGRESSGVKKLMCLEAQDSEKAAQALYLLQRGATIYKAAKETGISEIVLRRTASHHLGPLEKWRPDLVQRLGSLSMVSMEALAMKFDQIMSDPEELKKVSIDKLAVTAGIVTDKFLTINGQATSRVEHRIGISLDDATAAIAAARAKALA